MHSDITYEYLIRMAYQTKRGNAHGADADIYRRMETSYRRFILQKKALQEGQMPISTLSLDDLEHEYYGQLRIICSYLRSAFTKTLQQFSNLLSVEQRRELEHCIERLHKPTIEEVEAVIDKAESIMIDINLTL